MQIVRHVSDCPEAAKGCVATIGNFDGLHKGHKTIIQHIIDKAKSSGKPSALITFEPHPLSVLIADLAPFRITPFRQKVRQLRETGLDYVFCLPFNQKIRHMEGSTFIKDVLIDGINISHIVVGHDFMFGYKRSGTIELLETMSEEGNYSLQVVDPIKTADTIYSSTLVRHHLSNGDIEEANHLLGHKYTITGKVRHGDKQGRNMGFPTANLVLSSHLRPKYGVYAVSVTIGDTLYDGVANFGIRPTVKSKKELLEVHIFDYDKALYGSYIDVHFKHFIREEMQFPSLDALKMQIKKDVEIAKEMLAKR